METLEDSVLNVTLIEPRLKHPTIFEHFDALNEGEGFVILNDHDPKPVYYQLLGERGDIFIWEYLEQGPQWWKVSIKKRISGENNETLGQIATKDLRKAEIFKKYGLDFCCGGKKTVKEACAEKGLDVAAIEHELQQAEKQTSASPLPRPLPYNDWKLDFLADYIVNTHHSYVKAALPELIKYADKVARVHGAHHPELFNILQLVEEIAREMTEHMEKEETFLFPFIKQLALSKNNDGNVQQPIELMEKEHEIVGKSLSDIRMLSNNYALPEDACASYGLLYKMLEEFEGDMFTHIHLENNILFVKALELQKTK
ncbi:iron-sulfur cluster repair di-iron protein [Mucilaginibacter sp.]|jgi:regulator of cell morphogenesis and NO signaling|uniref:iron-sulfur cluster repair di-iron protein n=1 Tax=Mucilaginibacter sp. TaxID=1882438 RepID=UPI002CCF2676|nr:iron-sulfur cluster repair di-iron protein [Mucilaginibacter sp.]HTI59009.1 iron-sulfur cluster repair di-iron protein [Mucilaginibacter sp.]